MTSSLEASDWYCWQYLPAVGGREQVWHTALHTSWAVLPNTLHSTEYLCLDAFWEALQHLSFSQLLSLGLLQSTSRYSLHYMPALRSNRKFSGCSIDLFFNFLRGFSIPGLHKHRCYWEVIVVTSDVLEGYVQGAGGPNHCPSCDTVCALALMLAYRGGSYNEVWSLLQLKLGYFWLFSISFVSSCQATWWMSLRLASRNETETWEFLKLSEFWRIIIHLCTPITGSQWSQLGVMAASHCYPWWRSRSNILWQALGHNCSHSFMLVLVLL